MKIETPVFDRNGTPLEIGDTLDIYDWGGKCEKIGTAVLSFDEDEGRISTIPVVVEDAYDFWTKALPRSIKVVT